MSINGQGHSLTLVKGHSDFKVKCLTFGLYTQVSDSGPLGPLVLFCIIPTALRKAKIAYNFGLSECNRVKGVCCVHYYVQCLMINHDFEC